MGQSQSSGDGAAGARGDVEIKTSYYELLSVERQATDDEIKKAYRKKALELHPDRNYGNEEAATKVFAEVRNAYEILSDPQERAWYDSHESAILRGDDGAGDGDREQAPSFQNIRVTTADDLARVIGRFNKNVEFSDAPSGFFGFLREQFEHLAKEEEVSGQYSDVDVNVPDYPPFGHKDDTHDDVVKHFYAGWSSFSTVKTFGWKDRWRLSEAPDRRIRRLMEKENEALRQDAKREFNEAVRSLVAFVRKRDPRYTPSTQSEAERQKTLRDAAASQAARARAANQAKLDVDAVPEWAKVREPEELEESDDEEFEEEVLECVACNKVFKSERQWEAHERSKKHQKAVYVLQKKMRKDNAHLDLDSEPTTGAATPLMEEEEEQEMLDDGAAETEDHEERVNGHNDTLSDNRASPDEPAEHSDNSTDAADKHQTAEPEVSKAASAVASPDSDSDSDDEYTPPEAVRQRLESASLDTPLTVDTDDDASQPVKPKLGKAAQKRAKKAAATAETDNQEANHKCASCNAAFPSRTRLFQHIKDHGHAALKPAAESGGKKKKKGKK